MAIRRTFTPELLEKFKSCWRQKHEDDPVIFCRFYIPWKVRSLLLYHYDEIYDDFLVILIDGVNTNRLEISMNHLMQMESESQREIKHDKEFIPCRVSELKLGL